MSLDIQPPNYPSPVDVFQSNNRARWLVIDDDPLFREIARELLIQAGYDVALAENGAERRG